MTSPDFPESAPDLLRDSTLTDRFPGLANACDVGRMSGRLQQVLLGEASEWSIVDFSLAHVTHVPQEDRCNLVYELGLRHGGGRMIRTQIVGRVLSSPDACTAYLRDRVEPLAARMAGRPEVAPFATPAAELASLNLVVSVFPIDAELPTLVDATDSRFMTELLRRSLPDPTEDVVDCEVELVQYRRRDRCVLRYQVETRGSSPASATSTTIYGKIHATTDRSLVTRALEALREHLGADPSRFRFNVPRPLDSPADARFTLLEAIPGRPRILKLLKKRARGASAPSSGPTLEETIDVSAQIAATLHTSGIPLGPPRGLARNLTALRHAVSALETPSPDLARLMIDELGRIEADASGSVPSAPCFSHGDFKHGQILFDGGVAGLLDFDTVCQAEPARDLGHFLAYLRISLPDAGPNGSGPLLESLANRFLTTYATAGGGDGLDRGLRERVSLHERCVLVHLVLKSQQKLKSERLHRALASLRRVAA